MQPCDLLQADLYAYTGGNPVNFSDPTDMGFLSDLAKVPGCIRRHRLVHGGQLPPHHEGEEAEGVVKVAKKLVKADDKEEAVTTLIGFVGSVSGIYGVTSACT